MRLRKGDTVLVISGKDRGKTGLVERVYPRLLKLTVAGINIQKKHLRPSRRNPKGGVIEVPAPLALSKVMLLCPSCGKPTRVGMVVTKAGKERFCKRCQKPIAQKIEK
jgi:large subunit ribosomal protein L24